MPATSKVELLEFLARGQFEAIIGTEEGLHIDFKEKYDLTIHKGVRDLVADVAAFANAQGGIVVLGVRARRDAANAREQATSIVGIDPRSVNSDTYHKLICDHIFPLVRGVEIRNYQGVLGDGTERHLVAINVEAQADHDRPFIIDRVAGVLDDRNIPQAFGWPTRADDDTHWERAARMQQLIANGLRQASLRPSGVDTSQDDEAAQQLDVLDELDEWQPWPVLAIQVLPTRQGSGTLPDFFGEVASAAGSWAGSRASGFNLGLNWVPPEPAGNRLIASARRTVLILGRSGLLTTAALGSPSFLGWAYNPYEATTDSLEAVRVNPVVLIEFVLESLRFAYEFVGPRIAATDWEIRLRTYRLQSPIPLTLSPGRSDAPMFFWDRSPTVSELALSLQGTGDPNHDALAVLTEVYGQGFGLGQGDIPLVRNDRIDLSELRPS